MEGDFKSGTISLKKEGQNELQAFLSCLKKWHKENHQQLCKKLPKEPTVKPKGNLNFANTVPIDGKWVKCLCRQLGFAPFWQDKNLADLFHVLTHVFKKNI